MTHLLNAAVALSCATLSGSAFAQCQKNHETLFACKARSGERIALCASPGFLITDSQGTTRIAKGSVLQFRASFNSQTVTLPTRPRNSPKAFLADRGSSKAATSWWSNLSIVEGSQAIALEVGISDTQQPQIEFIIEDKRNGFSGRYECTDLAPEATATLPGVPDTYFRVVSALAE